MDAYADYDGLGLAALVRQGEVTPLELVDAAAARAERHNPTLNAIVYAAFEEARDVARGPLPDGPFRGVPFLIKDLGQPVKGWPRTSGTRFDGDVVDAEDSELVRRYRQAGVVLLGKTNTPEYGITGVTESQRLGPCRNPWSTDHASGGSSGGAAAATAAGIVPLAHASDGLGSIRIPAACCGLFGMKVTRDRNPNDGEVDRAIGLSVDHVVTRSVRDSAAMLDATGYPEPGAPYAPPPKAGPYLDELTRSPGRLRIAWSSQTPSGRPIEPEVQAALERTADLLAGLDHEVFPRDLELDWRAFYRAQGAVSASNFAAGMRERIERMGREPQPGELERLTLAAMHNGRRVTGEQVALGWRTLRRFSTEIVSMFEGFDVFLSPVMGTPAPPVGHIDPEALDPKEVSKRQGVAFPFTAPFNVTGQPSMSVPLAWSSGGLPIGMMFTGRYADEATLFRLAAQLEDAQPWADRRPSVWN
jgi:amidase